MMKEKMREGFSQTSAVKNRRSSNSEVGYKKPPKEHQFKPGESGNPNGPPVRKTQLWVYLCQYMAMTDAELEKLDRKKLTQAQHAALKLREVARNGKSGFIRLALAILDREEGKALQTQVVDDGGHRAPMTREELVARLAELDETAERAREIARIVSKRTG